MTNSSSRQQRFLKISFTVIFLGALLIGIIYLIFQSRESETVGNVDNENSNKTNETEENSDVLSQNKQTFLPPQLGHVNTERDRLRVNFGPAYYHPTGLYVEEGDKIRVTLTEHDQFNHPRLIMSPPVLSTHEEAIEDGVRLSEGEKEITAFKQGIIYLVNHSHETDKPPEVTIEGAHILPTFVLGETANEEWDELLTEHADAPVFELVSDKVTITAGMDHKDLVTDPEKLLIKHDEVVDIQAKASGLVAEDPNPVHHPTKYPYHFRHAGDGDLWMYAWLNHTGYHTDALRDLLDVETFVTSGWGPWHELGHVHQQGATTPGLFVEVTTNIFSMTVQREFEQPSRLEADGTYERAFAYLEGQADDYESLDVWELLVSLWQLDLAYGEELYPEVYRMVRETDANELPNNDEDKLQKIVYWTSKSAEQNLIPFFEKWGLAIREDTSEAISALGYPELDVPIWWNRDANNTIKSTDVTIDSLFTTVEAYEEDLGADFYEDFTALLTNATEDVSDDEKLNNHLAAMIDQLEARKDSEDISEKMYEILFSQVNILIQSLK